MKLPTNKELGIRPTRKDHRKAEALLAHASNPLSLRVGSTFKMKDFMGREVTMKVTACKENNTFEVVEVKS